MQPSLIQYKPGFSNRACLKSVEHGWAVVPTMATLESLLLKEKDSRIKADSVNNRLALIEIIDYFFDKKTFHDFDQTIVSLSKKRGLSRESFSGAMNHAIDRLQTDNDPSDVVKILESIIQVCNGKVYCEKELIRSSRLLSDVYIKHGDYQKACDTICGIQVEAFGSIDKKTKVEFILMQIELSIKVNDFSRARLMSRKLTLKSLDSIEETAVSLKCIELLTLLCAYDGKYLEGARLCIRAAKIASESIQYYCRAVILAVLEESCGQKFDFLNSVKSDSVNTECRYLISIFTGRDIVTAEEVKSAILSNIDAFNFVGVVKTNEYLHRLIFERVIEHNILVISKCFSNISLKKLTKILDAPLDEIEALLSSLVYRKELICRVNRILGVVTFDHIHTQTESSNLILAQKVCHLISKEELMVQFS